MSVEAERAMCRREERENASRIRSSEVEVEGTMRSEEGRTLRSPSTSGRYDRGGCTALHRHHSTALPASSLLVCLPPCLVNTPITSNSVGRNTPSRLPIHLLPSHTKGSPPRIARAGPRSAHRTKEANSRVRGTDFPGRDERLGRIRSGEGLTTHRHSGLCNIQELRRTSTSSP